MKALVSRAAHDVCHHHDFAFRGGARLERSHQRAIEISQARLLRRLYKSGFIRIVNIDAARPRLELEQRIDKFDAAARYGHAHLELTKGHGPREIAQFLPVQRSNNIGFVVARHLDAAAHGLALLVIVGDRPLGIVERAQGLLDDALRLFALVFRAPTPVLPKSFDVPIEIVSDGKEAMGQLGLERI